MERSIESEDELRRAINLATGKPLCENCGGTGNEFYSMYRECPVCHGTGLMPVDVEDK